MQSKRPLCLGAAALVMTSVNAYSQTATQPAAEPEGLAEVIVTAEKREENQQKAPAAITVVSGDELAARGLLDIRQAGALFPGVKFGAVETSTHLYIRGIGAEQDRASIDPLSTMTQDGVNLPREATGNNFFDVQSIQVLPGPQSTLYGTSAAGGTVNIVNNRPTDQQASKLGLEVGNFGYLHGTAVQNIPMTDKLFARAAFDYGRRDGFYTSGSGELDQFGGRVSFLYEPTDAFTAYVWGSYGSTGGTAANTTTLTGDDTFADPKNPWNDFTCTPSGAGFPLGANPDCDPFFIGDPKQDFHTRILAGEFNWHAAGMTFSFIPSALYDDGDFLQYFGPFSNEQHIWNHQYSGELRVTSDAETPLKWVGGLYYYKDSQYQFFNINDSPGNPEVYNRERTYAVFGQATFSATDSLRFTGGLRYSSNHKEGNGCNCAAGNGEGVFFSFDHTWPRTDWKVGVEMDLAERSLFYATVQTGYNNGAYQYFNESGLLGPENTGRAPLVQPSKLVSYTAGVKNRFLDNRLEINNEIYFYDYKDLLIAPFDDNPAHFGNTFYNAEKVEIYGDQLDIKYLVTDNDQVQLNIGYNHARAIDFVVGSPPQDFGGLQLIAAPDFTVNLGLRHTWSLTSGADVTFGVNSHFESSSWGTFDHAPTTQQDAYTMTDVNLTYTSSDDKWSVGLWGKNLENEAVLGPGAFVGAGDVQGVYWLLAPRTYGVRMNLNW